MANLRDFGYRVVCIEVTNRCNMACSFCPLPIRSSPLQDLPKDGVFRILESIATIGGIDWIAFHQYGEPLLYPGIWDCIDRCKELGLRTQLVTNGLLLTERNVALLFQHQPDILRISAQTLNPAHHAATRGIDVGFDVYIQRVAACLGQLLDVEHQIEEIRTDVAVNDDRYYGIRGKLHLLAQAIGADEPGDPTIHDATPKASRPHMIRFLNLIQEHSRSFRISLSHLDECIDRCYSSSGSSEGWWTAYVLKDNNQITYKQFINGRRISSNYPVERSSCDTDIVGILADGTVTSCCLDYKGFTKLGNIFSEDLISILEHNRSVIDGLHTGGQLHFEACKTCHGAPTRVGAAIKNVAHLFRYRW